MSTEGKRATPKRKQPNPSSATAEAEELGNKPVKQTREASSASSAAPAIAKSPQPKPAVAAAVAKSPQPKPSAVAADQPARDGKDSKDVAMGSSSSTTMAEKKELKQVTLTEEELHMKQLCERMTNNVHYWKRAKDRVAFGKYTVSGGMNIGRDVVRVVDIKDPQRKKGLRFLTPPHLATSAKLWPWGDYEKYRTKDPKIHPKIKEKFDSDPSGLPLKAVFSVGVGKRPVFPSNANENGFDKMCEEFQEWISGDLFMAIRKFYAYNCQVPNDLKTTYRNSHATWMKHTGKQAKFEDWLWEVGFSDPMICKPPIFQLTLSREQIKADGNPELIALANSPENKDKSDIEIPGMTWISCSAPAVTSIFAGKKSHAPKQEPVRYTNPDEQKLVNEIEKYVDPKTKTTYRVNNIPVRDSENRLVPHDQRKVSGSCVTMEMVDVDFGAHHPTYFMLRLKFRAMWILQQSAAGADLNALMDAVDVNMGGHGFVAVSEADFAKGNAFSSSTLATLEKAIDAAASSVEVSGDADNFDA